MGRIDPTLDTLMTEPPPSRSHPAADERGEPEHALQVEVHHLVPHGLGHLGDVAVQQRHPRVVHEHVDPSELVVSGVGQRLELVPYRHVARPGRALRRPMASISSATA